MYESPVVLMADDDPEDRLFVRDALEENQRGGTLDYTILCVSNGIELLEYLRGDGQYADRTYFPWPGLVLIDLNMPLMSGFEVLAEIKGDASLRSLPVVVMSTSGDAASVQNAYALGANAYIVKPSTFTALADAMHWTMRYWFGVSSLPESRFPSAATDGRACLLTGRNGNPPPDRGL